MYRKTIIILVTCVGLTTAAHAGCPEPSKIPQGEFYNIVQGNPVEIEGKIYVAKNPEKMQTKIETELGKNINKIRGWTGKGNWVQRMSKKPIALILPTNPPYLDRMGPHFSKFTKTGIVKVELNGPFPTEEREVCAYGYKVTAPKYESHGEALLKQQ